MMNFKRYSFQIKTKEGDTYTFRFRKSYKHHCHEFFGCGMEDVMFINKEEVVGVQYSRVKHMSMDEFKRLHTTSNSLADLYHDNPVTT